MTIAPGTRFGPYEIVAPIGAGGMGEVFKARDTRLNRSVALKVLSADLAKTPQFKIRFSREAKAISQLSHPNICALYDIGDNYLVMELLEGETLADRLERGPLPLPDVTRYGAQIAEALDRAHRAGIVHRDLKPGNIMITRSGVKLLDFGLAKSSAIEVTTDGATATEQKPITQEGTIIGTLRYMAPEQLQGDETDPRTDIFAMGAVLYEMATGQRAFEGKSKADLIASILTSEPPSITAIQPLTPAALDRLVHTCLQKDRDARFQNAHDVALELGWIQDSATPIEPKHRATRIGIPLWIAAIVIVAIGTWFVSRLTLHPVTPRFQRATFHTLGYPTAVFSADQQSIVYSSLAGGPSSDIYVAGVGSAEVRSLHLPGATVLASARNGDLAVLLDPHYIGAYTIPGTLARMPLAGGTPRELVRDVQWADWSPTSDDLLILRSVDGKSRIELPI
ncbi:MAG TPA: protein kinase, partial [Thermoanaerobaculia bacterium]|nr:protein kinase [Thermoanaerobaculia bacterium]